MPAELPRPIRVRPPRPDRRQRHPRCAVCRFGRGAGCWPSTGLTRVNRARARAPVLCCRNAANSGIATSGCQPRSGRCQFFPPSGPAEPRREAAKGPESCFNRLSYSGGEVEQDTRPPAVSSPWGLLSGDPERGEVPDPAVDRVAPPLMRRRLRGRDREPHRFRELRHASMDHDHIIGLGVGDLSQRRERYGAEEGRGALNLLFAAAQRLDHRPHAGGDGHVGELGPRGATHPATSRLRLSPRPRLR